MKNRNVIFATPFVTSARAAVCACLFSSSVLLAQGKSPSISVDDAKAAASEAAVQAEAGVNELLQKSTEVVDFSPGSSTISASQLRSIRALLSSSDIQKTNKKIYVAAWADEDSRANVRDKNSRSSVLLANERIASIQKTFQNLGNMETVIFINAESNDRPGFFPSKEEKINAKMSLNENSKDAGLNEVGRVLHERGGRQKAVILIAP